MKSIHLSSGYDMPALGLGTWQLTGETCRRSVADALGMGYTHIDTAIAYGNHPQVGEGIKDSGVDRESFFLTTKLPLGKHARAQILQQGGALLQDLGTDYVDLLLLHWPSRTPPLAESFAALEELVNKKMARSIGISNFSAELVEKAVDVSSLPIVTNQVEFHPYLYQKKLQAACEAHDMIITAYSPLARGDVLQDERLGAIAEKHGVGVPQVVIAWLLSKGVAVIPKASSKDHLRSNLDALELTLDEDDITTIDGFPEEKRHVDWPGKHFDF